jgi:DNA polymerase III epsilon subunit family exonuclease
MRWLKMDDEYLQSFDFVAFDTETTGLWAPTNRIVELGAVKFRLGQTKTDRFQSLVNPERKIPLETIQVHGITDSMVRSAETIDTVLEQFFEFCGPESVLIAHNAMFDISFVGCESDRVGVPLAENHILDTVDIYRQYCPGLESYSLLSLARAFNIDRQQNHRADDDAALVWKLFMHISREFPYVKNQREFRRAFAFYSLAQWQGEVRELLDGYDDINVALKDGRALEIIYASQGQSPEARTIRPRRVHYLKSAFYIIAYCEKAGSERTFRLDRIKSFQLKS